MLVRDLLGDAKARLAAAGSTSPDLDATLCLCHVLGVPKHVIRTEPTRPLSDEDCGRFFALIADRARRRPMSQILGHAEFCSLDFIVTDAVLSPRPETEMLVERAVRALTQTVREPFPREPSPRELPPRELPPRVAELGVGSGAVSVSIAVLAPSALVFASDISAAALAVAAASVARHGVADRVTLRRGDMATPLVADGPFDVVVSNPPYVRRSEAGELDPEVLWEPACAIFCDGEPADVYAGIARVSAPITRTGGQLLCELPGSDPAPILAAVTAIDGWRDWNVTADLAGLPRVLSAFRR